ncbi:hypothetical protein V8C42DRAFT_349597 [Trichoderma barbatum]
MASLQLGIKLLGSLSSSSPAEEKASAYAGHITMLSEAINNRGSMHIIWIQQDESGALIHDKVDPAIHIAGLNT